MAISYLGLFQPAWLPHSYLYAVLFQNNVRIQRLRALSESFLNPNSEPFALRGPC